MRYLARNPDPPLDLWIASIWYCESDPNGLQRVLPSGAAQLLVNLKQDRTRVCRPQSSPGWETTSSGTILSGVQARYCVIDTAELECVMGVAFRAGGTLPFFRIPAQELRDRDVPLEALWGRGRAMELREQLLAEPGPEAKLARMERAMAAIWRGEGLHPAVELALDVFAKRPGEASIAAVVERTGLSPKRFIERFKSAAGLAPKHYCRILRFQQALANAESGRAVEWTRIAADCGYFDQAHLIHDFRNFAGITPTGYACDRTEFRNHVNFLQSDAGAGMR